MGQDLKISQLPAVTNPLSGDVLPLVNYGYTKKITIDQIDSFARNYSHANFLTLTGGEIQNLTINDNLTVKGNLDVQGELSYIDTQIISTSAMVIDAETSDPALRITQRFTGDVILVEDSQNPDSTPFVVKNDGNVGIGTNGPGAKLTIAGTLSASSTINVGGIGQGEDNSVVILDSDGFLRTDEINPQIWDTTANFISASDGFLTENRLTKATNTNGINESIIFDDGVNVGIATDAPNETLTVVGSISATGQSFIAEPIAFNAATTKNYVDTLSGEIYNTFVKLTENRPVTINNNLTSNNILINDNLSVVNNISALGTITIGDINSNSNGTSFVIENNGLLQKRTLNNAATDTTANFVSASDGSLTVNQLIKATNANGINESIIFDDGVNVGIGETSPEGKLHVKAGSSGSVTAQSNSIGIFENSGNSYISVLSPNAQYAGLVMGGPGNPYGAYVNWNHDNNALKVATAHSRGGIQLLVNTEQEAVRILSGGNVGIGTINPKEKLTISGNLSSSGTATIGTINTGTGTSFVIENNGLLQKRTLNTAALNTASNFVSASNGNLVTNYLTKASNSNGINESIISDDGTLVYVGGNLTVSGNLTAFGNAYFANTVFTTTSALSVVNTGPGPALYVYQAPGTSDVASFYDGDGIEVLHVGNCDPGQQFGKVGVNTGDPNQELTVVGDISATGVVYATNVILSGKNLEEVVTTVQSNSAQWASNVDTGVRALTSNWQSTYLNQSNYLPLSGGSLTGSLSARGSLSASNITLTNATIENANVIWNDTIDTLVIVINGTKYRIALMPYP